jgi:hypothetical protein
MHSDHGNLTSINGVWYYVTVLTRHPKSNGTPEEPDRGALGRSEPRWGARWSAKQKTGPAAVTGLDAPAIAKRSGTVEIPPSRVPIARRDRGGGAATHDSNAADITGGSGGGARARASAPDQARARASAPDQARARASAPDQARARASAPDQASTKATSAGQAQARAGAKAAARASDRRNSAPSAQGRVSVGRAGDPRLRGPVAPPGRSWRRRPRYVYRLIDLDELFATAEARADATPERGDRSNRQSNWRVLGVVLIVAAGLAIATAGLVNEAVTLVMNIFAA